MNAIRVASCAPSVGMHYRCFPRARRHVRACAARDRPIPGEQFQPVTQIGDDYCTPLVAPYVRASARGVVGRTSPEEIYSTKRGQIEREIREEVISKMLGKHIRIRAILIREVRLPVAVRSAIQTKPEEEQKALQMQFILERTRLEAELPRQ